MAVLAVYTSKEKEVLYSVRDRIRGDAIRLGLAPNEAYELDRDSGAVRIYDPKLLVGFQKICANKPARKCGRLEVFA